MSLIMIRKTFIVGTLLAMSVLGFGFSGMLNQGR